MIQIYKDFYLGATSTCFVLMQQKVVEPSHLNHFKGGNVKYDTIGYYTKIESIYQRIVRTIEKDLLQDEEIKTLKDFIQKMCSIISEIEQTVHQFERIKVADIRASGQDDEEEDDE